MPLQASESWLTIVPIDPTRSSYNGFFVFPVHATHGFARRVRHSPHGVAIEFDAHRHGIAAIPDASPALQYSAEQFRAADPSRVRHVAVSGARHASRCRSPATSPPRTFGSTSRDLIWEWLYRPIARYVGFVSERANRAQLLTIRQYLGLVFIALVEPAVIAGVCAMIRDLALQFGQMLLVLADRRRCLTGFVRKVKARLQQRQGPPLLQPYRDLWKLLRKEVVLADNASWLFRVSPYLIFAATWTAASLVPTFATGLHASASRPI